MSIYRIDKIVDNQIDNIIDNQIEYLPTKYVFSPSDISNLLVRFNADHGILKNGTQITGWIDQQNGILATGYNGPLLSSNLGKRNSVSFDGTDSHFLFSLMSGIDAGVPRTFVVIGKYNSPTITNQQGFLNSSIPTNKCYIVKGQTSNGIAFYVEGSQQQSQLQFNNPGNISNYHITTVVHNGVVSENFMQVNGVRSYTLTYGLMTELPEIKNFIIGGRTPFTEILNGNIIELLIYNKQLTNDEIKNLETYFTKTSQINDNNQIYPLGSLGTSLRTSVGGSLGTSVGGSLGGSLGEYEFNLTQEELSNLENMISDNE